MSESPEPSAKLIPADGETSRRAKSSGSGPLRSPSLALRPSLLYPPWHSHSHFRAPVPEITASWHTHFPLMAGCPAGLTQHQPHSNRRAQLGWEGRAVLPDQSPKSCSRTFLSPAAAAPACPGPAEPQPHLVDFVGFGKRLTDVQVRIPGWLSQRVVDITWDRLRPD